MLRNHQKSGFASNWMPLKPAYSFNSKLCKNSVIFTIFGDKDKITWDDAHKACKEKGMEFAQPRDKIELAEVADLALKYCKDSTNAPTCKVKIKPEVVPVSKIGLREYTHN